MLILSEDIRDQSRKLSKIAKKIVHDFLPSQIFAGGHCKNCAHFITPASRDVDWIKSREDTHTSPEGGWRGSDIEPHGFLPARRYA